MFEQIFRNIDDVLWKEAGCATELDYTEQTSWMLFLKYLDNLEHGRAQEAELVGRPYAYLIDEAHRWSRWAAPKKADGSFDHDEALTGDDLIHYVNFELFPYLQGVRERASGTDTIEYKIGEIFGEIRNKYPEWDGEPLAPEPCTLCGNIPCTCAVQEPQPCALCGERPCVCGKPLPESCMKCGEQPCGCERRRKVKIQLADGKERTLQHMSATSYWGPDGKPMSAAEFVQRLFGELPALFQDEEELRKLWGQPDTRKALLAGLEEKGYGLEPLREIGKMVEAEHSDLYDVLAYIAFNLPPVSRSERVDSRREQLFLGYDFRQTEFLHFVLGHYVARGVTELDTDKLPQLIELKYHSLGDAVRELGSVAAIRSAFVGFQQRLY